MQAWFPADRLWPVESDPNLPSPFYWATVLSVRGGPGGVCLPIGLDNLGCSVVSGPVPWREILADALTVEEVIGVVAAVRSHLGREPTRSEATAARRAANGLADAGQARVVHVHARPGRKGDRTLLLLASLDAVTDDEAALREIATRPVPRRLPRRGHVRSHVQTAKGVARTLFGASSAAALVDVERIAPAAAAVLVSNMDPSLRELRQLRDRLARRAAMSSVRGGRPVGPRRATAEPGSDAPEGPV